MKRLLDIVIALGALIASSPVLFAAAIGIRLTSAGPILYKARRMARDRRHHSSDRRRDPRGVDRRRLGGYFGREFTMYKFRTMRIEANDRSAPITAHNDPRIFAFGAFLRATKVDELPQLFNVLKGNMTLVGPRPEAPEIVRSHYTAADLRTLQVPPGVTSPGTIYYYTHCESTMASSAVLDQYVEELLPAKLALDRVYLERATILYDIRVLIRTFAGIAARVLGSKWFPDPPELRQATIPRVSGSRRPPKSQS